MAHGDRVPAPAAHAEPDSARDVLAEVDDRRAARRALYGHGTPRLDPTHGRAARGDERGGNRRQLTHGQPVAVVEARCRPVRLGEAPVGALAVVQAGRQTPVGARPPVAPGRDRLDGAVVVGQLELGDRPDVAAVDGAPATAEAEAAAVPPLGDGHPDHVRAGREGRCDVGGAVAEAMSVAGPTGSEHLVADGRPVEPRGVHAERGGVEAGPPKAGAHGEGASEPDRPFRVLAHTVGGDRHRHPVRRLEQGDLEVERARSTPSHDRRRH